MSQALEYSNCYKYWSIYTLKPMKYTPDEDCLPSPTWSFKLNLINTIEPVFLSNQIVPNTVSTSGEKFTGPLKKVLAWWNGNLHTTICICCQRSFDISCVHQCHRGHSNNRKLFFCSWNLVWALLLDSTLLKSLLVWHWLADSYYRFLFAFAK